MLNDVLIIIWQVLYSDGSQLKKELILKFLYEKVYGVLLCHNTNMCDYKQYRKNND